jgi:dihydrofolate reductase
VKNTISLIVAIAKNNAIGKDNQLLWKIRDDLKLFKQTTDGHVVIHGRKSFESVGKPLPNRTNIIITRNADYTHAGAFVVHSLKEAIALGEKLEQKEELFILGGAEIYKQSLGLLDKMYISHVETTREDADTFFPEVDLTNWQKIKSLSFNASDVNEFGFEFAVYEKGI